MPDAPVTAAVLEWAIEESGMSVENIASRLDVKVSEIQAWMLGTGKPTKGQLTALADTLKRPRVMFFLPEPPAEKSLPDGLRRPAGERAKEHPELTFDERLWVRRARHLQEILNTLAERGPQIPPASKDDDAEEVALRLRDWAGVTWTAQRRWRDPYTAFRGWRQALEADGLAVLAVPMGSEGVRGFALSSAHAPMIAVNTADGPGARSFTLFHELAHLTQAEESSCAAKNEGGLEGWCDRVASRVIIPRSQLRAHVTASELDEMELVKDVADAFKVSRLAAAVALEDGGYVESAYARAKREWPMLDRDKKDAPPIAGRTSPRVRIAQYGEFAVGTIIDALNSERINELDASDYLRLDRTLLPAAREQLTA